jgi:inosine-uridine nucleoside N-ribohydrolase
VAIELRGEHTYGMTVCDSRSVRLADDPQSTIRRGGVPNAEVAVAVRPERFWEIFLEALATY